MEVFCIVLLKICLISNFFIHRKLKKIVECQKISNAYCFETRQYTDNLYENITHLNEQTENLANKISKISTPAPDPIKPIKTNNWDSVREAFKGPTKVEFSERT